jgi:hypothetical protein
MDEAKSKTVEWCTNRKAGGLNPEPLERYEVVLGMVRLEIRHWEPAARALLVTHSPSTKVRPLLTRGDYL